MALMLGFWTAGFAGLNYLALRKWSPPWRERGWIPTIILALWDIYLLSSFASDPTSHNLWPIEAIGLTVLSVIVLAFIAIAQDMGSRRR
jgi:hypothetical protein